MACPASSTRGGPRTESAQRPAAITATIGTRVTVIQHMYANGNAVELHFYRVDEFEGELENRIFHDVRWVERAELTSYDFLEADVAFIREISAGRIL